MFCIITQALFFAFIDGVCMKAGSQMCYSDSFLFWKVISVVGYNMVIVVGLLYTDKVKSLFLLR